MSYTTFGQLLKWLEIPAKQQASRHRAELVRLANQARQELYSMYSDARMSVDVEECFEVQAFCLDCHNCCSTYNGITLTAEMDGVESIHISTSPVRYHSRWREVTDGVKCGNSCQFEAIDQGSVFPFERDASCCSGKCIAFRADSTEDTNKSIRLRYTDTSGEDRHESILLSEGQWMKTNYPVKKLHLPGAVVLPELCGPVAVAVWDGTTFDEISRYSPWERVPSYGRIKIHGVKAGDRVRVRANRRYHDLYFDDEIVESDNQRFWVNLASYIIMHDMITDNPNQMNIANGYLATAKRLLIGDKSRTRGDLMESKMNIGKSTLRRSRLPSRR